MSVSFVKPDIRPGDFELIKQVLESGWITTGPLTKQFEKELTAYTGTKRLATMSSQTMAAELCLRLLGIGPGDEVIVPAYTYSASCSIIYHVGATPVLVDSRPDSFEMDLKLVEEAITEKTKAIIPVDLGGIVCDYDAYFAIAEQKKALFKPSDNRFQQAIGRVIIIADTAHSLGGKYKGQYAGSIADFSNFSFHAVKNLTTAEGGAATWKSIPGIDDEEIYKQYMLLSLHGQNKDALAKTKLGSWEYDIIEPYFKCNLSDIASALGMAQLKRYDEILERRHAIIQRYQEAFADTRIKVYDHGTADNRSSAHLAIVHIEGASAEERNLFIELMAEDGVSCNVHYKPLPMLSAYHKRGFDINNYPNAYAFYENQVSLPLFSLMTDEEVETVIKVAKESLEKLA